MTDLVQQGATVSQLVLSLFPGIDMLGRGFEEEGYCVVRGPDLIFGGDIRSFTVPAGRFDGVIGGSPCPDFSRARRSEPTGIGLEMLAHYQRIVSESSCRWWLLENVPSCPSIHLPGYSHQRIDIDARDVGLRQRRLRHFQFGHIGCGYLSIDRPSVRGLDGEPTCLASEGNMLQRRTWPEFCELQGLPADFELPAFTQSARYRAVGNGVPIPMARLLARAVAQPVFDASRLCGCGCARPVSGKATYAGPACRKRVQRIRDSSSFIGAGGVTGVTGRGTAAIARSHP